MTLDEYTRIKRELESEQRELARAEGQLEQLHARAESEFGCGTPDELGQLLKEEEAKERQFRCEYDKAVKRCDRWKDKLEESA